MPPFWRIVGYLFQIIQMGAMMTLIQDIPVSSMFQQYYFQEIHIIERLIVIKYLQWYHMSI